MSQVLKIEIFESAQTLKEKLKKETNSKKQQKLQVIYWIKTKQAESVGHLAVLVGKDRTTVSRWLSEYRKGGLDNLLTFKVSSGRPAKISEEIERKLVEELKDKEGFSSYKEIQKWLKVFYNKDVNYSVVHKWVRYRLKAKLKVPRPVDIKQKEGAIEAFKKNYHLS